MSAENPRWYKWYPTEETDLGSNPIEGDFDVNDRFMVPSPFTQEDGSISWLWTPYFYSSAKSEWGRNVSKKVGPRIQQVFEAGVKIPAPIYTEIGGQQVQVPVYYAYMGDGVCALKVPNAELEEVTTT